MKRKAVIYKAHNVGNKQADDAVITIKGECPEMQTLDAYHKLYLSEAMQIEDTLYNALPGGTYDRLLGLMLARKATHFRVSHAT